MQIWQTAYFRKSYSKPISSNKTGWCLVGEFDNKKNVLK